MNRKILVFVSSLAGIWQSNWAMSWNNACVFVAGAVVEKGVDILWKSFQAHITQNQDDQFIALCKQRYTVALEMLQGKQWDTLKKVIVRVEGRQLIDRQWPFWYYANRLLDDIKHLEHIREVRAMKGVSCGVDFENYLQSLRELAAYILACDEYAVELELLREIDIKIKNHKEIVQELNKQGQYNQAILHAQEIQLQNIASQTQQGFFDTGAWRQRTDERLNTLGPMVIGHVDERMNTLQAEMLDLRAKINAVLQAQAKKGSTETVSTDSGGVSEQKSS